MKSGTIVDGYNSSDPADTDNEVKIGTQSTSDNSIVLNNGSIIKGDVAVGMNGDIGDVIKDLGAEIDGDKYVATSKESLPAVTVPALPNMGKSLTVKSGIISLTESDSGTYSKIDLQKGELVVTEGDVVLHITGDIKLGNDCEIVVKDGATLTVYIDGNIACDNGSGINTEAPPEEAATLQLYRRDTTEKDETSGATEKGINQFSY